MKDKNADLDRWLTKLRSPYERTFSKQNKRVRYKGGVKNQGAEFLYAIAYNFRRLLVLNLAWAKGLLRLFGAKMPRYGAIIPGSCVN